MASAKLIKLENDLVKFGFDARTGSLCRIEDRERKVEFLREPGGGRLFRIMAPGPGWRSRHVDSHGGHKPEFTRNGDELIISYAALKLDGEETGIAAKVTVKLPEGECQGLFTLAIENQGAEMIDEVRFPWVGGWTGISGPGKDQLIHGHNLADPYKVVPTGSTWTLGHAQQRTVPTRLTENTLPIVDVSDGTVGLWTISYHRRRTYYLVLFENLAAETEALNLSWAFAFTPFLKAGEKWQSPPVGIGVHEGDWHGAADRYREWLGTWWKPKTAPGGIDRSLGFQNVTFRNLGDGAKYHSFSEIPEIAADGKKYGIDHLCVWDGIAGRWSHPLRKDIWEEEPEVLAELKNALGKARDLGCNVSVLLNTLLILPGTEVYAKHGEALVARNMLGQPYNYFTSLSMSCYHAQAYPGPQYFDPGGQYLCPASKGFEELALGAVRKTLELGFTSVFLDQGSSSWPCLAGNHDHVSASETAESAKSWLNKAAEMVRANNPEGYLLAEHPDIFLSEYINVWWDWLRSLSPSHIEIIRYTLPRLLHTWESDMRMDLINKGFALGCLLAFTTDGLQKTLGDFPELAQHVKRLAKLREATAEFTLLGDFKDQMGLTIKPKICAYVYDSPQAFGIMVAEIEGRQRDIKLRFDPTGIKGTPNSSLGKPTLYRLNGKMERKGFELGNRCEWKGSLGPYEVAVIGLEKQR